MCSVLLFPLSWSSEISMKLNQCERLPILTFIHPALKPLLLLQKHSAWHCVLTLEISSKESENGFNNQWTFENPIKNLYL